MIKFPVRIDIFRRENGTLTKVEHLSLPEPGYYAIGRLPDNEIRLDAKQVSREHAFLAVGRDTLQVADRGSINGTFIGDEKIDNQETWDGSRPIRIEPFEIHLTREGAADRGRSPREPQGTQIVDDPPARPAAGAASARPAAAAGLRLRLVDRSTNGTLYNGKMLKDGEAAELR